MRPESSASIKDSNSPNPGSPSLFSEARTSASIATTPTWPDSPFPGSGHSNCEDRNLLGSDSVDPASPQISTRLTYSPPPPQTPERFPARPKSGARALALDLPRLPESSESLPSRPRLENNADQITDCPISLSTVEASTSDSAGSSLTSLESSLTDSEQSDFEDVSSLSSGLRVKRRRFSFIFNILASESSHRAKARENRIKRLFELLKELCDGKYNGTRLVIERTLNPSEYRELRARVEADEKLDGYFNEKLRFEYSNARRKFIIYMPTGFHDRIARECEYGIRDMLREIASGENSDIAKIAENVKTSGGADVRPPDLDIQRKNPDGSFQLKGCDYPGLLIEVAWAHENRSELEQKARDYFDVTQGEVRTVVCFDFSDIFKKQQAVRKKWVAEEGKRKKKEGSSFAPRPLAFLDPAAAATPATFSIWRARQTAVGEDSVHDQIFRLETQKSAEDVSLVLSLEDFVCEKAVRKLCPDIDSLQTVEYPQLVISSRMLCDWFEEAVEGYRPEWGRSLQLAAQLRQKRKDAERAKLKKEADALSEKKVKTSIGNRVRRLFKGRALRSAVQKEIKKNTK